MIRRFIRKRRLTLREWRKRQLPRAAISGLLLCAAVLAYTGYMSTQRHNVDQRSYQQLLTLIARAESNDNYNAYYANPRNTSIRFTSMTIEEVLAWQREQIAAGSPSTAVGRYQIINTTLKGLVDELGLAPSQLFDESMQDRLAITLLERRGAVAYINKEITPEEFAANLAKEWAALPRIEGERPTDSYYAGDGLNKARLAPHEVLGAIEPIKPE